MGPGALSTPTWLTLSLIQASAPISIREALPEHEKKNPLSLISQLLN